MVTRWLTLLLLNTGIALAITPDELRQMMRQAEDQNAEYRKRAKQDDLLGILPKTVEESVDDSTSPIEDVKKTIVSDQIPGEVTQPSVVTDNAASEQTDTHSPTGTESQKGVSSPVVSTDKQKINQQMPVTSTTKTTKKIAKQKPLVSTDEYIPPARQSGESRMVTKVVESERNRFGIRIGTWMTGELVRNVSNADNGDIEILLTDPAIGDYQTLPAGTILFGSKSFNQGAKRLNITVTHGITPAPDNQEFKVSGTVYSDNQVSGLPGVVVRNRDAEINQAGKLGAAVVGQAMISNLGEGVVADAAKTTSGQLLDNEIEQIGQVAWTIHVSPQPVQVRINATF